MGEDTREQFKQVFTALDWFIVSENARHQHDLSTHPIPRQTLKIGGDTAHLLAKRPSKATVGMTVEIVGDIDHRVRERLSDLLLESGFGLEVPKEQAAVSEGGSWSKLFESPRLEVEVAGFVGEEVETQHNPTLQRVLQRLNFEKLLMTPAVAPRRVRVTLKELMDAGKIESRICEVLPAILLWKPQIIRGLEKDLKKIPELEKARHDLLQNRRRGPFLGVDWARCARASRAFKNFLDHRRTRQKSIMMTLRLSQAELDMLRRLKQRIGAKSVSEAILQLARERLLGSV